MEYDEIYEMSIKDMVNEHNEVVQKYNDLLAEHIELEAVLRKIREAEKTYHEIITEHDDWEQLNQQKLNSTNEER
jgi:hypothetical protein